MSKTVTLETAQALKAAFDAAGIEMPETEQFWWFGSFQYPQKGMITHALISAKDKRMNGGILQIPAPDAEELGKWLMGLKLWGARPREILTPSMDIEGRGYFTSLINANQKAATWTVSHSHPTIAEGLAALLLKLFEKDPDQIKKHLAQ